MKKPFLYSLILLTTLFVGHTNSLQAVTYVTETGGYAYEESRRATNLAPAIGLGALAIAGVIAIAVQNSHGSSSSCSSSHYGTSSHYGSYSSSY